jgi:hypothetical protein
MRRPSKRKKRKGQQRKKKPWLVNLHSYRK